MEPEDASENVTENAIKVTTRNALSHKSQTRLFIVKVP